MIKKVKRLLINLLMVANFLTIALMLVVGYSDHVHPSLHPLLACAGMVFPFFIAANMLFVVLWVFFSWKRLWIPVTGFALAYVPINIYIPLHGEKQTSEEDLLTVISYNVCCYGGNYKYEEGFDTVFSYLMKYKPDIVCIQEDIVENARQLKCYSDHFAYNDTMSISFSKHPANSLGIHTRFPILRKERIEYESNANGSVAYFLKREHDTIIVINNHLETTHLSASDRNRYEEMLKGDMERDTVKTETWSIVKKLGESMAKRASQAEAVHNYVVSHQHYPIILCGDFNDTPISYTRHTIAQGLTDCYVKCGRGIGVSFNRPGFNFRIDHFMCSSHFEPVACKIDNNMDASDHYPMLCWLKTVNKKKNE